MSRLSRVNRFHRMYNLNDASRRIPRPIRDGSNDFTKYNDVEFRIRYRLKKEVFLYLLEELSPNLTSKNNRGLPYSPMTRLLLTIRFYATRNFQLVSADLFNLSQKTASRIVTNVSNAIARLHQKFVAFPQNLEKIKADFYRIAQCPGVIGCIDCTHVSIENPGGDNAVLYINRKTTVSINVQVTFILTAHTFKKYFNKVFLVNMRPRFTAVQRGRPMAR